MYSQLRDTSNENVERVNQELNKLGVKVKKYNGVPYGAFVTMRQIEEDARYMNEEPEGLKQAPDWPRPIKPEALQQVFWNKIGLFCLKLSGGRTDQELTIALVVALYMRKHRNLFNYKECSDYTITKVVSYFEDDEIAKKIITSTKKKLGLKYP